MANKKIDALTGEVNIDLMQECTVEAPEEQKTFKIHCKPVFNYQSIEFDWEIPISIGDEEFHAAALEAMERFYSRMLEMLVRVSQNAPQAEAKKPAAPVEELASEKQKEILRNFHIDFKEPLTKKQAHALIKKSMDQEIF